MEATKKEVLKYKTTQWIDPTMDRYYRITFKKYIPNIKTTKMYFIFWGWCNLD